MKSPEGDPTFIKNKDQYFIELAKTVARASTHPTAPGGCVLVRDREVIGDGRSVLCHSKVEIDCVTYAIGTCAKRGTPTAGAVIYSTRYPFSASIFQCHLMGIRRVVILAHDWEPFYKDEFRRAARLARELSIAIEPIFADEKSTYGVNSITDKEIDPTLYTTTDPLKVDQYDTNQNDDTTPV